MTHEIGGRHGGYQNPEVVLAAARRRAEQMRREAEREAATIRREAAAWAARVRLEAEQHRDRVLAELDDRAEARDDRAEPRGVERDEPNRLHEMSVGDGGEVIDLVAAAEARRPAPPDAGAVAEAVAEDLAATVGVDVASPTSDGATATVEATSATDHGPSAADVVGNRSPQVGTEARPEARPIAGTSIETKVHEVVRVALRRTFERAPRTRTGS